MAEILRCAGGAFRERRDGRIDAGRLKVMADIEACRSAVLGGHMYACDGCGREHPLYNSCRNRADAENGFDELKNQWGWGGFTTRDLKRCQHMARLIALIYNWWSLFVRLADPDHHREAITSRPLLLHGIARQTHHAGQTRLTVTSSHGRRQMVVAALRRIGAFFQTLVRSAEQLSAEDLLGPCEPDRAPARVEAAHRDHRQALAERQRPRGKGIAAVEDARRRPLSTNAR